MVIRDLEPAPCCCRWFIRPGFQHRRSFLIPWFVWLPPSDDEETTLTTTYLEHSHSHGHADHTHSSKTPSIASSATVDQPLERTAAQKIPNHVRSRSRSDSFSSLYGHPAATRASLVQAAQDIALARSPSPERRRVSQPVAYLEFT